MQWLERILGVSEYRRYGEHEYYEYPRSGGYGSGGSGSWEMERDNSWSWRGPSIFEGTNGDLYEDVQHSNMDEGYSRDSNKYVSQYGGTTEIYTPASGYGRKPELQPSAFDSRRYKTDDYDCLARAFQESFTLDQHAGSFGTPATTKKSVGMSTCAGCHGTLGFGRFLTCLAQNWHPSCFACKACHQSIVDKEFSVHGSDPYHRHCYKKLFHPKCEICYNHIPLNARGQIEYRSHPFWNQRYCPAHERDGSTYCCSCDRIEAVDQRFKSLGDGRKACSECMESAVMTTKTCQPLYHEILNFYKTNLDMPIKQQVPMLLVEREALNNASEHNKDSHTHVPETRGLCLSEEQIFPALEHEIETRRLPRQCEVTAILVLYGLPRLLTGSILAHELMHAWIRLDGRFPNLENDVEEGICQAIAHMWLKSELKRGYGGSSINKRLGEFFIHQIETDSSPIYGHGFRAASAAVAKYGLSRTIHHLRQTGEFLC